MLYKALLVLIWLLRENPKVYRSRNENLLSSTSCGALKGWFPYVGPDRPHYPDRFIIAGAIMGIYFPVFSAVYCGVVQGTSTWILVKF